MKTGIGRTWMGVLVMAAVTSLPELVTGASAILIFDVANIAAGDAIGSCMFNLLILAFLDVRDPAPLSARVHDELDRDHLCVLLQDDCPLRGGTFPHVANNCAAVAMALARSRLFPCESLATVLLF